MKRKFLWMALALVIGVFSACSDDNENEVWKELPTTPITIDGTNAIVTVNNVENTAGNVIFKANNEESATLTLTDVIPGYPSLTMDVTMSPEANGYAFSGSTTVNTAPQTKAVSANPALLSVDVNGTISTDGKVTIALTAYGAGLYLGTYKDNTLALTYSDAPLLGKTVYYTLSGSTPTPVLTLENIVPGEPNVSIEKVYTNQDGTFEGNITTPNGATVAYKGQIETASGMTLALKVKLPYESPGMLTLVNSVDDVDKRVREDGIKKHKLTEEHSYYFNTSSEKISGEYKSLVGYAGGLLELVLKTVTFHEDGNVTASYCSSLPANFDMSIWLKDHTAYRPADTDWLQSPINLANWYRDGENLYIVPNLEMILRQIEQDAVTSKTRAGNRQIENTTDLTALLQQWLTTGIRLTFKENPYKEEQYVKDEPNGWKLYSKLNADYLIYLNQDDIKPLIPLLRTVIDMYLTEDIIVMIKEHAGAILDSMFSNASENLDIKALVADLLSEMATAEKLEIGLCFNKN